MFLPELLDELNYCLKWCTTDCVSYVKARLQEVVDEIERNGIQKVVDEETGGLLRNYSRGECIPSPWASRLLPYSSAIRSGHMVRNEGRQGASETGTEEEDRGDVSWGDGCTGDTISQLIEDDNDDEAGGGGQSQD